jgi:hypothetical protein
MITDRELANDLVPDDLALSIARVCSTFDGQIDDLYSAVGMVVVGRLFGWRVMRLAAPRRVWTTASDLFGDPKVLMSERGELYWRSVGCRVADAAGDYWRYVRGQISLSSNFKKSVQSE